MLIVFTTVATAGEAEMLAGTIVEAKLAACVQILPRMKSIYVWDGKIQQDDEHLLLIKTLNEKFDALADFIKANHGYEVPEIVAVEAANVSERYLAWLTATVDG